jgi:hypothetical protein
MNSTLITGMCGMICILLAFVLNVFKRIEPSSMAFLWLNLAGSVLLAWYAILLASAPFLILNAVWSVVALWGILHHHPKVQKHYKRAVTHGKRM